MAKALGFAGGSSSATEPEAVPGGHWRWPGEHADRGLV